MLILQFLTLQIFFAISIAQPLDDSNEVEDVAIVSLEQAQAMNVEFDKILETMKEGLKTELKQEFKQELDKAVAQKTQEIEIKLKVKISKALSNEFTEKLANQQTEIAEKISAQLTEDLESQMMEMSEQIKDNIFEGVADEVAEEIEPVFEELIAETEHLKVMSKLIKVPRTCEEWATAGMTNSGVFRIDPDGEDTGADPINVHCDFTDKTTVIQHNMADEVELEQCENSELGCQKVRLEYEVPMSQVIALTQLSETCEQAIQFDCFVAPLREHGEDLGYWLDRNGNKSTFFHGNLNPDKPHICQCGLDQSCVIPELPCNCDAKEPNSQSDKGVITDKNLLPITEFAYGPLEYEMQEAKVKIGHLKCSGRSVTAASSSVVSCESLKRQGVSYSGIFNLKDEGGNLRLGYCNMEKGLEDADLEEDTLWQFGSGSGSTQPYSMGPSTSRPVLTNGSIQISRDDCNFGSIIRNNVTFDIDYETSQDCYMVISGFPSNIRNMVLTFENFNSESSYDKFELYKGEPGPSQEKLLELEGDQGRINREWSHPQQDWKSSGSITLRWKTDGDTTRSNLTAAKLFFS